MWESQGRKSVCTCLKLNSDDDDDDDGCCVRKQKASWVVWLLERSFLVASALENRTSSRFGRARTERKALKCALILMAGPIMCYLHSQLPAEEQNNIYTEFKREEIPVLLVWGDAMGRRSSLLLPPPPFFVHSRSGNSWQLHSRASWRLHSQKQLLLFFSPNMLWSNIFVHPPRRFARTPNSDARSCRSSACVCHFVAFICILFCFCDVFPSPRDSVTTTEQQPRLQDARFE